MYDRIAHYLLRMKRTREETNMDDVGLLLKAALPIDNIDQVLFDQHDGMILIWVDMQD